MSNLSSSDLLLVSIGLCACLVVLLYLCRRRIIWKLFSFDAEVSKLLHQKKSSEVRVGKLIESLAPLLDEFPVDVKKSNTTTTFIGQPIDFIHFDPEEGIVFIEVKSGNAELSRSQAALKKAVMEGKVFWEEVRIGRTKNLKRQRG